MRATFALLIATAIGSTLIAGCGDDDVLSVARDLAPPADLTMPDLTPPVDLAPYPDLSPSLGIGMPCPNGNECMPGLICFGARLDPNLPPAGYCTKACIADPECGADAFCGPPIDRSGNLCWHRCGPGDTCATPGQVCSRRLGGFIDLVNKACIPGNAAARDGSSCKSFGDCNKNQLCANNPFDFPGGVCITVGCTVGDNTTCAPGGAPACFKGDNVNVCFPACNGDGDCRINEGYKCLQPPGAPQKVCLYPNPLGGNCKVAKDCNGGGPWSCIVDVNLPGGYCSIIGCDAKADTGCPTNGHCLMVAPGTNLCLKACSNNAECEKGTTCKPVPLANGMMTMICAP